MKLKTLIKEWGAGGVVSIKAIGNPFKKQNSRMNESIPALGKEYINYQNISYQDYRNIKDIIDIESKISVIYFK